MAKLFNRKFLWGWVALILVTILVGVGLFNALAVKSLPRQLFQQARIALIEQDYPRAKELASSIPPDDENWAEAQLILGEAYSRTEDYQAALSHYAAIDRDRSPLSVEAAFASGEIYRQLGELSKSEEEYHYVLRHKPSHVLAHDRLARLEALTRRIWESQPHFMAVLKQANWTLDGLAILGDLERPLEEIEYLQEAALHAPNDRLVSLGLAAHALYVEGDSVLACEILEKLIRQSPELLTAHVMMGEVLINRERQAFLNWHAALPADANDHPDIWFIRGQWARRQGNLPFAARCFWETVRRAPTHRRANYQLGQVLVAVGEPGGGDFERLAARQFDLTKSLDEVLRTEGRNEIAMKDVVALMEQTGRIWEACAWARTAARQFPQAAWPKAAYSRLQPLLNEHLPQVMDSANLALKYDLSKYSEWDESLRQPPLPRVTPTAKALSTSIRFELASDLGLDFQYYNSDDPSTKGARMFEQTGGGTAVIDLDSDHWPDLYFTQGAKWPHGAQMPLRSAEFSDQVFRNLDGMRFVNVTKQAGLGNQGFGQGVSVGDVNEDGFPDLYVANVGENCLYLNNGDGTFTDQTGAWGINHSDWTTSCVIVDLNADGLSDLFDVNYVTGPEVYTLICQGKGCSPKVFTGVPDRLLLNQGDGRFQSVPIPESERDSKGLGILAFDLDTRGRPCLLIANDQVPNFLLHNSPSKEPPNIRLENQGFTRGLAFNMDGLAMACMGIAADDANGDGQLDFFLTNFKDESNTLYIQDAHGLFNDLTHLAGLAAPSLPFVGWGTQFLDADLDGAPDLVVVNGHVDDYRDQGGDYHMPAQVFQNKGTGQFVELEAKQLGSYFQTEHLGRGLARLDWNRDGLMDFAVSNIQEPAALLTNTTKTKGHYLGLRLHATTTARDAIGSVVEVATESGRWTKQLVAGDGFQASNERLLQFGLGGNDRVSSINVTWPSGRMTTVKNLPADGVLELVEGSVGTFTKGSHTISIAVEHVGLPE